MFIQIMKPPSALTAPDTIFTGSPGLPDQLSLPAPLMESPDC